LSLTELIKNAFPAIENCNVVQSLLGPFNQTIHRPPNATHQGATTHLNHPLKPPNHPPPYSTTTTTTIIIIFASLRSALLAVISLAS